MNAKQKVTFGGRDDYFAVNSKPIGTRTSFSVSGRLGELRATYPVAQPADLDCRRLNRAFELGREVADADVVAVLRLVLKGIKSGHIKDQSIRGPILPGAKSIDFVPLSTILAKAIKGAGHTI